MMALNSLIQGPKWPLKFLAYFNPCSYGLEEILGLTATSSSLPYSSTRLTTDMCV